MFSYCSRYSVFRRSSRPNPNTQNIAHANIDVKCDSFGSIFRLIANYTCFRNPIGCGFSDTTAARPAMFSYCKLLYSVFRRSSRRGTRRLAYRTCYLTSTVLFYTFTKLPYGTGSVPYCTVLRPISCLYEYCTRAVLYSVFHRSSHFLTRTVLYCRR